MAIDKEGDGGEGSRARAGPTSPNPHLDQPIARKGKSCKGILYYDSLLKVQSKDSICYGVSESIPRVSKEEGYKLQKVNTSSRIVGELELEASKEERRLLNFKYACAGYSVHLSKDDSSPGLADKRSELPLCVGVEVLMDKRNSQAGHRDPDDKVDMDLAAKLAAKTRGLPPVQPQTQTNKPSSSPSSPTADVYLDRFTRNAKLVAASVKKNVHRVANQIKRTIDDIVR